MHAIAYKHKCGACRTEFEAPELPDMSYGFFVMMTLDASEAAFLDAHSEAAFSESCDIVKRHPLARGLGSDELSNIKQAVFSVTCDKTPGGKSLKIGILPSCPSCGSRKIESWSPVEPCRIWPLPTVGHRSWNAKSPAEREALIDVAVRRILEGGTRR